MSKKTTSGTDNEVSVLEETVKQKMTAVSAIKKIEGTVVYIGPTIENIVTQNIVFNNGIPQYLREEMLKQPLISNLIVPIGQLAGARSELRNPQSTLSIVYNKIKTK
ncbi:hypothetical protein [Lachnotalea glycerini]|uniref:Uncharacterized protein n=1 Tax=Lachnotalea glycerini TaxID=1763509 RepID=A0A371JC23_9FIRM|nr:hypothetical protein [Lachnotalea glycerini]RDY30292.1 hypothetical protein CG710_015265 [Lachnotalea glycerini]